MRWRKNSDVDASALESRAPRAAASRAVFVAAAVLAAACSEGDGAAVPIENGRAVSAVTPPAQHGTWCTDAGVAGDIAPGAEGAPARSACTVQLTRRGKPLTIPYQIK